MTRKAQVAKSGSNAALGRNPKPIVKAKNLHSEPKVPKGKVSSAFRDTKNRCKKLDYVHCLWQNLKYIEWGA